MTGFELLDRCRRSRPGAGAGGRLTGKDLSAEERGRLKKIAKSIVLKDVQSPDGCSTKTALFLHRVVTDLPPEKQEMLERLQGSNESLARKEVLVVDDEPRNIFA